MWIFSSARTFLVVILATGLALLGPAANLAAATLIPSGSLGSGGSSAEPFGLSTSPLSEGGPRDKWLGVERELEGELLVLALCQEDRSRCQSLPARQFLAIVD